MKILAVSDQVVKSIYSEHIRERFGDVDMVLSCGDLPYSYLEYIASMLNVPCFFVHGNHDQPEYQLDGRVLVEPKLSKPELLSKVASRLKETPRQKS